MDYNDQILLIKLKLQRFFHEPTSELTIQTEVNKQ